MPSSAFDMLGFFQSTSGLRLSPGGSTPVMGDDPDEPSIGVGGPNNTGEVSAGMVESGNGTIRILPKTTTIPGSGNGGALASFEYTQSLPASVWVIKHDLNTCPTVTVIDSAGNWVIGGIHYDSLNQVTLTFSGAFSGKAYCK